MTHRAVFLDRDGTMIEDVGYLDRLERLKLFPYTVDAVRLLDRAGFKVVVVTSQNGIANGILTEEFLSEAHSHLSSDVRSSRNEDQWLLLLPALAARIGRAVPRRVRLPQTKARYDTHRCARSCARSRAIVRRRRSMARHRNGIGRRYARQFWFRRDTARPRQHGHLWEWRMFRPSPISSKRQAGYCVECKVV